MKKKLVLKKEFYGKKVMGMGIGILYLGEHTTQAQLKKLIKFNCGNMVDVVEIEETKNESKESK